ncbi:MAG: SDR family oxidoreductase [Saprospiraceae bacterium]|nr:SDR family oxidoreductase [Saprospiraceae bacterium]MDZ4703617.1 SDR family oxidoreductase [Saprospiraceae bacterium]
MSKTYLFAGASSAIAVETAKLLQAEGHTVIGVSTKPDHSIYDDWHQIEAYDFGNFPAVVPAIDGLVYFPGTINLKPFARLTAADFNRDLSINTLGAVAFAQAYLGNLKQSVNASIVFISTVAVQVGLPFHASVSMAKGALEGLTKALAAELAPTIRVNCIAPSLVNTPLGEKFINTPEKIEQMQKRNPMRKVGEPADVAQAVAFLLSEKSAWISGQIMAVDGGMGTIKN